MTCSMSVDAHDLYKL